MQLAVATASDRTSTTVPMPSAYAMKAAMALAALPTRRAVDVTARNGAMVQESDASAKDIP